MDLPPKVAGSSKVSSQSVDVWKRHAFPSPRVLASEGISLCRLELEEGACQKVNLESCCTLCT